ncbi:uncharacterized protein [Antedon mediterranea]|uniref:uncharacterized protein isoform X2 n=1 Tax=Antedon mediterranea TaxID=105859 RepID=UPI003AF4DFA8
MIMDELEGSANDSSLEPSIHPVSSHDALDVISSGCVEDQDGHQITSVDHAANVLPQTKVCSSENDKNRKTREDDQQAISSELASGETRKSDVRNLGEEGGSMEELENATESLEEMKAKLSVVHNQAELENMEHNWCFKQLADQSSLSLTLDQENILLHIFHELEIMDGGPDGFVKDHVFFQKVILFIWNQRNELKDKIAELQQKKENLDEKQTPDRLKVETLQKQLTNTVSETSMMGTTFNETIDQLASENKELHVTIKHLEKTICALHDNNLCRLEVDKIMDHHSSNVDKKTDSQVGTVKAEFECIHQHCSLLKEELSSTKIRNENLMARLTQMEEEGQQYLEQLKTKQFQLDHLQIQFKTLEKQEQNPNMNDKTTEQLKIEEYITELEIELKEAKEQIEELKHVPKWIDYKAWNNMLSEKLILETELIDMKEKRFEESKKLSELQQEHEDVQSKLGFAVQKSEMDGLKKKLQLEEEKMMLRVDVDGKLRSSSIKEKELKKELDEQKRIIHESEIMINQLQNNLRSKENEVSSLNQELAILLSENVQIKQTLETITVDNNNKKLRTDYTTEEELMINLTEARIEIKEIKHKLQTAENNFLVEQTMNKSLTEQQAKSNEKRCSLERALNLVEVEKGIWNNTENELNKQIDKLCNEQERYMQGKQDADHQTDLFIEATRQQSEISEKYEGQLNDIKKQWGEEKTDLEKQRDLLKEEAQQMKKMVMEKEGRIYTLEDSVKQMKKDKRQNIDLRTKLASTKTSLRDMDAKMEKLSIERDGYVKETAELKKTLHNAEDNKAILESHISEKEKTLYSQTVRYSCLNSQLQKTQNSLATVHEALKNSKDYNASLLRERSDLQAKLESLREAWEDDKTKLALIQESFTNTESKHEKTVEMLNEVQESNNSLNSSLLDLDSKYSAELAKVKLLLEHDSELETKITSYDMRVNILNEQVAYYKNRLKKEELRLHRAKEDILQNNNETMYEKQNVIDDLNNENKILVKENARLKQDLTTVMKCMEEQKIEFSKLQSSAYDNDVKQRERQWKVEQLTKELLTEKQIQHKLEKSCNDKDQELCSVKKQILEWEEKQKEVKSKHFKNDRNTSDQSIVDLEIMIKKLSSEVKSMKSVPQENDCDDKKKIRELEWKLHVIHMQRLADQETIGHLQDNLKDVISKFLDRRDGIISSKNDRTSDTSSDICQALTRAQVRAYAMNLNESPLYLFENSQHGGLQAPDFSIKSTNMRTSTPNHSRPTP